MKRQLFFRDKASVVFLMSPGSIEEAVFMARDAEFDGADGIAVELSKISPEQRTKENFAVLMSEVRLPWMFILYRSDRYLGNDDEARQKVLLLAAEAGAGVIDVMGDLYDPSPFELTMNPEAVEKQKKLIDEIHTRGAKVIMSSHMLSDAKNADQVLEILKHQSERGADILKIVTAVNTEDELAEAVRTTMLLRRELDKPFVHLGFGKYGRFHRYVSPVLGSSISFAVHEYDPAKSATSAPPRIDSLKNVMNNFHWHIDQVQEQRKQ